MIHIQLSPAMQSQSNRFGYQLQRVLKCCCWMLTVLEIYLRLKDLLQVSGTSCVSVHVDDRRYLDLVAVSEMLHPSYLVSPPETNKMRLR